MKKKRLWCRFAAASVLAFIIMLCVTGPIYAHIGPKPSVELKIKNAPEGSYAVGLLVRVDSYVSRDDPEYYDSWDSWKKESAAKIYEYDSEGWSVDFAPGGRARICFSDEPYREADRYSFTYYAPSYFKVILITSNDGAEYVSNEIETTRFSAYCCYDFETGVLAEDTEQYASYDKNYFRHSVIYYIATLIVEGLVLFAFGLCQWRNIPIFIIANTLTQFYLHATMFGNIKARGASGLNYTLSLLGKELLILIVETVLYAIFMKQKNEKHGRKVAYGIVANLVSLFVGLIV